MSEDVLVSVCDSGVVGVSISSSSRERICGRELSSSMIVGNCANLFATLVMGN